MKKIFISISLLFSSIAFGTTLLPIQLLNPVGSSSGQVIASTGSSSAPTWSSIPALSASNVWTGANNFTGGLSVSGNALALGGATTFSGAYGFTGTLTGTTAVTFPTSGTLLTGNQTITLTGDTTGSGATAITTTTAHVNGVSYGASPSTNTVPVVTGSNAVTYETVPNAALANSSVTIGSTSVSLGATASSISGLSLVTPALGTPASGVATNLTGTASGLTAGNVTTNANLTGGVTSVGNAATVVTNANLTGPITSSGNATSVATQTGTGSTFAMQTNPVFIGPTLGVATATSFNGNIWTTGTGTLTLAAGKTHTVNNSITLAGTDSTTMTFPSTSASIARTDAAQTFTGAQTFSSNLISTGGATPTGNSTSSAQLWNAGGTSTLSLIDSTQSANNRNSEFGFGGGVLTGRFVNDAYTAAANFIVITGGDASGVSSVSFPNGTLSASHAVTLPGLASSSAATTGSVCWTTSTGNLTVDTTTTCLLSSRKYKRNIRSLNVGLSEVMTLRPVSYYLKPQYDPEHIGQQVGLIAEEVAKVDDRLVAKEEDGSPHSVRYIQLTAVLVKAIQEQQAQIKKLQRQIKHLMH